MVHGFKAEETLFIDDSIQHIEGARKAGINAYHLRIDKGETILDLF
jgi:putative hydrolase of the HAD superfamily